MIKKRVSSCLVKAQAIFLLIGFLVSCGEGGPANESPTLPSSGNQVVVDEQEVKKDIEVYATTPAMAMQQLESSPRASDVSESGGIKEKSPADLPIKISTQGNLISLDAHDSDLNKVLDALSNVSGVLVTYIDLEELPAIKISVSFKKLSIEQALKVIATKLPAGGYALVEENGKAKRVYIVTKRGKDRLQDQLEQLLERVNKGEKPKPTEVANWLNTLFSTVGVVDLPGASMFSVPVLLMLIKDYAYYKEMVLSLFLNQEEPVAVRLAMLEIIDNHWDDPDSKSTVKRVFMDVDLEVPVILGQTAVTLAKHGVDIGGEVLGRYEEADHQSKFYYATALAQLNRKEAVPLLKADLVVSTDNALRVSTVRALGRLAPDDIGTIEVLDNVLHSSIAGTRIPDVPVNLDAEVLSMNAVLALAQSKTPEAHIHLLRAVMDESLSLDVRLTAIESLQNAPQEVIPEVLNTLARLNKEVSISLSLDETARERLTRMIARVTGQLLRP